MKRWLALFLTVLFCLSGFCLPATAAEDVLLGDVDQDGQLTVSDCVLLRRAIIANNNPLQGDLNADGVSTVIDVVLLRMAILSKGDGVLPEVPQITDGANLQVSSAQGWPGEVVELTVSLGNVDALEDRCLLGIQLGVLCDPQLEFLAETRIIDPTEDWMQNPVEGRYPKLGNFSNTSVSTLVARQDSVYPYYGRLLLEGPSPVNIVDGAALATLYFQLPKDALPWDSYSVNVFVASKSDALGSTTNVELGDRIAAGTGTISVSAEVEVGSGSCGEDLLWFLDENERLLVTGDGEMVSVNGVSPWNLYRKRIRRAEFEDGATCISAGAFAGCAHLEEASLSGTILSIGSRVFENCTALTKIWLPSSVVEIIPDAFQGCDALHIYGYPHTCAEQYADRQGIPFVPLLDLLDADTGVVISGPASLLEGATLSVNTYPYPQELDSGLTVSVLEIALEKEGQPLALSEPVQVKIPLSQERLSMVLTVVGEDLETAEDAVIQEGAYRDGRLVFETDRFQTYLYTEVDLDILLGDLNNDFQLSVADVVLLRRMVLANEEEMLPFGDLNLDGALNVADVVLLRRMVLAA